MLNEIELKLKNIFKNTFESPEGPAFILSDGSFCVLSFYHNNSWIDQDIDGSKYYARHFEALENQKFNDHEIEWIAENLPQTNNISLDEMVVRLPSKGIPNENQLKSIELFIDKNLLQEGYIRVGVEDSNTWREYVLWEEYGKTYYNEPNEHISTEYIMTRIRNYYKSGILAEDLESDVYNVLSDNFILTDKIPLGPTYILRDGSFIDLYNSIDEQNAHEDFLCHAEVEDVLIDNELNVIKDTNNDGSPTIEFLGAIRCNDLEIENNYILLPKLKPTENQFNSLLLWLDKNSYKYKEVVIGIHNFDQVKIYNYDEYIPDDIIKKIKKYYNLNILEEDINNSKPLASPEDILEFIYSDNNLMIHSNPSMFASCILRNGDFLDIKESNICNPEGVLKAYIPTFEKYCDSYTHEAFEYYIHFRSQFDSNVPYFNISSPISLYPYLGTIKLNGVEGYIQIFCKYNLDQQYALEEWLWRYAETHSSLEISFDLPNYSKIFRYEIKDFNIEPLVKMLNNFQRTGRVQSSIRECKNNLNEELLLELNRSQLINKSKKSDNYKDTSKGKNRWERRNKSQIDNRVQQYNKIDMNKLFKNDELVCGIGVHGETNSYTVTIRYLNVIKELANEIKRNNNKFEFKCVLIALQRVFNSGNVFVSCTCPDWKYRQAYHATKDGYNSGPIETRASDITNKNDSKGAGCKHVNLVIGNVDWIMKIASVINNYIHYMKDHMERQYADIIFPKLFGIPYQKAVQLNLFDTGDDLSSDQDTIQLSNRYGRDRTKFKSDVRINNARGKWTADQNKKPNKTPLLHLNINNNEEDPEEIKIEK